MNILLTNHCNRKCRYCFAQERISHKKKRELPAVDAPTPSITREDFETAIRFATRSKIRSVGILGGEPSLHEEFLPLLQIAWDAGLETRLFTNGLWPAELVEAVAGLDKAHLRLLNVVVNLNEPAYTPAVQRRKQERVFERLGSSCTLSFNIFHPDFDPAFLVDTIRTYRLKRKIRLGIAQPLARLQSEHVDVGDYPRMVPSLMELARLCNDHDVGLGFDCGFTLCMFTAEELGQLMLSGCRIKASCGPAIDVGTDLSVWACFPLSTFTRGVKLTDFKDHRALSQHFRKSFARLYRAGALPDCIDCRHRRRRQCSGGCAAHVYRRLSP